MALLVQTYVANPLSSILPSWILQGAFSNGGHWPSGRVSPGLKTSALLAGFNHSCTCTVTLAGTAPGVSSVGTVTVEVVSHPSPGLVPSGKRKSGSRKWRGEAPFSLAFLHPFLPGTWHHIGYALGATRELVPKQDVHTASGAGMVRWCVGR